MTARQGKVFVIAFMTVTLLAIVAAIPLAIWKSGWWLLLLICLAFYM